MKVLIIGLVDYTKVSGGVIHQLAIIRGLSELGHRVVALAPRTGEPSSIPEILLSHFRFTPTVRAFRMPPFLNTLLQVPVLVRVLFTDRPDVIYLRSNTLTCVLILLGRLFGVPVVSEHNTWQALERRHLGRSIWFAAVENLLQAADARLSTACRAVTEGIKAILVRRGCDPSRIRVIGNGADTDRFRPMDRSEALAVFGLDPGLCYVGFIGSLTPWHGVHTAVEAMAGVVPHAKDARLLIFGDGPERARVQALARDLGIAEQVLLMGRVSLDRANPAINCFDIALAPFSRMLYADVGVATVKMGDYAAAGRFVIGSNLPGLREMADGGWIDLVEPDDPEALARGILASLGDMEAVAHKREHACAYAAGTMNWNTVVAEVASMLTAAVYGGTTKHVDVQMGSQKDL